MSQDQTPRNTENLNEEELKATTGGSILGIGGDNSSTKLGTQGYVNLSNTDSDGDTESTNIDFGSGSLLDTKND